MSPHPDPGPPTPYPELAGVHGDLRVWRDVEAVGLGRRTDLLVHLPPEHDSGERRFPVVYLHDGHNLFDPARANGGMTWAADRAMAALHTQGIDAILVGVPCSPTARGEEYTPYAHRTLGGGRADDYLAFLTTQVKPMVDAALHTLPGPEHTVIAGSSLGGVVSMHAWLSRPEVFGGAGVFSPAFWWPGEQLMLDAEAAVQAGPRPGRVYLDVGGHEHPGEPAIERAYVVDAERVLSALRRAHVPLRYVYDSVAHHHESAWAERLPSALAWLLSGYAVPPPSADEGS